jgi:hypothetical protein
MDIFDKIRDRMLGQGSQKLENVNDQSPDEQKLVGYVKERIEEARMSSSRISHEGIWMTNIAYLMGFDNVTYDTATRQYRNLNNTRMGRKNRVHVNRILPTIQNRLARLCKNPPRYDVRPESTSTDDKDAARLGVEVLTQIWDKERINEKRLHLMMWVQQCGYAFMFVTWDDEAGKPMIDPQTNELSGYEGDIRVDVSSPFEVFTDPLAKSQDELSWLVRVKVRKLEYFQERYPDRGHLVKEESAWLLSTQYELKINSLTKDGSASGNTQSQMKNSAIECVYFEKRSRKHPKGRMITIANGVLLEDKELPVGEIPCVKFDDVIVAGKYASESTITHLRPLQDYKNMIMRKRSEWVSRMLAGKYLAAKGHGMSAEALNNESGEVVEFNPVPNAPPPTAMNIPSIPQYVYQEDERVDKEMFDISGIGEISRGSLPSAGIPAVGMQFLQEQDETRLGVITEQHEHSYAKLGQLVLMYVGEFYTMPRLLKVAGEGLDYAVKSFTGQDLKGNYDVCVIRGSSLPGSKVLKRQEILNAYQQGLLGQPGDPKLRDKLLDMLEFGDVAEIYEDHAIDMNQIKEHLMTIEREEIPMRSELDNHDLHVQEKNKFRKTDKFKTLSGIAQQILLEDIDWHVDAIVRLTMPQVQQGVEMGEEMVKASAETPIEAVDEQAQLEAAAMADAMPQEPPMEGMPA